MVKVREDLTGKQFGRLKVLKQAEDYIYPSGNKRAQWLCECSCLEHNHIIVKENSLKNGNTQSCGCLKKEKTSEAHLEDLTGKIFGRLTVLKRVEDYVFESGERMVQWLCECSCSEHNKVVVTRSNLKNGNTRSCGCLQKEFIASINKKENKFDLSGKYGVLWETNTDKEVYFDLCNADKILQHSWHEDSCGYTATCIGKVEVRMHAFLGCKGYDHKNRNKKDNRLSNLRPCTTQQNLYNKSKPKRNTSGIMGVSWHKFSHKWMARLHINHQCVYLGIYTNKDDAIRARLNAEVKYFGEFAPQQHLYERYGIKTLQNDCANQTNTE